MDKVVDILPRIMNDAMNRMNGAYRANDNDAGEAHFRRFNKLWDLAVERQSHFDTSAWGRVS